MSEALRMLAGPVIFLLWLAGVRFWFVCAINQWRAAKNRKPGVSWGSAYNMISILWGRRLYTDEGEKNVERCCVGCVGFLACFLVGLLIGWLAGYTH